MIKQFITHMYSYFFGEVELTISVNREGVPRVTVNNREWFDGLGFAFLA